MSPPHPGVLCSAGQQPRQALVPVEEQCQGGNLGGSKRISHELGEACYRIAASFDIPADSRKQSKNNGKGEKSCYKERGGMGSH